MIIAGTDLDPCTRHTHNWFTQILIGEPDGFEHGARRRSVGARGNGIAVLL